MHFKNTKFVFKLLSGHMRWKGVGEREKGERGEERGREGEGREETGRERA